MNLQELIEEAGYKACEALGRYAARPCLSVALTSDAHVGPFVADVLSEAVRRQEDTGRLAHLFRVMRIDETTTHTLVYFPGEPHHGLRCDACGKSIPDGEHATDDEVCQGGDGPGFFLCSREACVQSHVNLPVNERVLLFRTQRERNEKR